MASDSEEARYVEEVLVDGMSWLLRAAIRAYQLLLAPVLPSSCRYYPSCSHYAADAIGRHGPWRGSGLAIRRLLRCQPWGGSGYDPVP